MSYKWGCNIKLWRQLRCFKNNVKKIFTPLEHCKNVLTSPTLPYVIKIVWKKMILAINASIWATSKVITEMARKKECFCQYMHVLVIMSCNDLSCIFKFGLLLIFIAPNSQAILYSKHFITLITSRSIKTGLLNHNKFLETIKLSLHPTSSTARRNHILVYSNVSIITNQSYIAKITFRLKFLFSHIKLAIILLSSLCLILPKWSCYWPMLFGVLSQTGHCRPFQGVSYWKVIIY